MPVEHPVISTAFDVAMAPLPLTNERSFLESALRWPCKCAALALQGTLTLAGMHWHKRRHGIAASRVEVGMIARQSALISGFLITILLLAARDILRWWNILPLAILTFIFELLFLSLHKRAISHPQFPYAPK